MEILLMIFIAVTFFISGWVAREVHAANRVELMLKELDKATTDYRDNFIQISIEQHNGMFYVYSINDKSFMAQGETRSALEESLAKRYPGKKFAATPDNLKEMGFVNDVNN